MVKKPMLELLQRLSWTSEEELSQQVKSEVRYRCSAHGQGRRDKAWSARAGRAGGGGTLKSIEADATHPGWQAYPEKAILTRVKVGVTMSRCVTEDVFDY